MFFAKILFYLKKIGNNLILTGSGGIVSFILLFIFFSIIATNFLKIANIFNVLDQVVILGILVIGQTFVIITGNIDISVGSTVAVTVMIMADLSKNYGLSPFLVIPIGIISGIVIGIINGLLVSKLRMNALVSTLAMYSVLRGLAFLYTDGQPIYPLPDSFRWIATVRIGDLFQANIIYLFILIIIAQLILGETRFGRYVYAVGGNPRAAAVSGIPYSRIVISCYMISGASAALAAAILGGKLSSGSPKFGEPYLLTVVAAAVLGGASLFGGEGNILKGFIGALVLVMVTNGTNLMMVPMGWQQMAIGLVLALAVFLDAKRYQISLKT